MGENFAATDYQVKYDNLYAKNANLMEDYENLEMEEATLMSRLQAKYDEESDDGMPGAVIKNDMPGEILCVAKKVQKPRSDLEKMVAWLQKRKLPFTGSKVELKRRIRDARG